MAAVLQAFEEAGAAFEPVLDLVCQLGTALTGDPWVACLVDDAGQLYLAGSAAADIDTLADIRSTLASLRVPYDESLGAALTGEGTSTLLTAELLERTRRFAPPQHLRLTDRCGFDGGVVAPMRVRGNVIGVLWWACQRHRGAHDADDVAFLSSVAARCALAIDNARLSQRVEAERNQHAALLAQVSDAVCIVESDGTVRLVIDGAVTRILGWTPADLVGSNIFDLVHHADHAVALDGFLHALGPDDLRPIVVRVRHKDGSWRHMHVSANNLLDDPAVGGVVVTASDVTERVIAAELLTAENEILELVATEASLPEALDAICGMLDAHVHSSVSSVWLIDQESGELVATAMPGARDLPRRRSQGRAGAKYARSMPSGIYAADPETDPMWAPFRDEARANGVRASWTRAITLDDGRAVGCVISYLWELRSPDDMERQVVELAARLAGVAVRRAADAERLAHLATHDVVTGLPNRRLFIDRLELAVARQRRGSGTPAVLFIDLDRFKQVNDRAGHAVGDEVLRILGSRIIQVVRPTDLVARFGGDEFAVLCDETVEREAVAVAERLLAAICEPVELNGLRHHVSASVGIACGRAGVTSDALVRRADVAMYRAKARGSGEIVAFRTGMADRGRADLEADLRRAIDEREIEVHYQPIVDLRSGAWVGVEALARWTHPRHGKVPPQMFVSIAEETGLIWPLGDLVLGVAAQQGAVWQRTWPRNIVVSVNVSGRQLTEPRFATVVQHHLEESGLDPSLLHVELTETTMMEDYDTARAAIASLQSIGVNLVIDDFGTGHSTIARLRHFPAAGLKLDQSFVLELGRDPASEGVVAAVVQLAHAVKLAVVAEGVETAEQLAVLRRLGVDAAQGYLFAAPAPAAGAVAAMRSTPAVFVAG